MNVVRIEREGWLRAIHVKDGDFLIIMDEGEYLNPKALPFKVRHSIFEISVMLPNNYVMPWLMNKTTQLRCVAAWGEDTKNWINRRIRVKLKKHKIDGEIKTAIYGIPEKTMQTQLVRQMNSLKAALDQKNENGLVLSTWHS